MRWMPILNAGSVVPRRVGSSGPLSTIINSDLCSVVTILGQVDQLIGEMGGQTEGYQAAAARVAVVVAVAELTSI